MSHFIRRVTSEPRWIMAALWPLLLLTAFIPAIPTPSLSSLTWRQETALALLLSIVLGLLAVRKRANGAQQGRSLNGLLTVASLSLFVIWSAASVWWATSRFPAFHYALTWSGYLLFFLLVRDLARSPRLLRASLKMLAMVVFMVSLASIICFWSSGKSLLLYAWGLGEPLVVIIPIFAALALRLRRRRVAAFCGATAALAWLAMLQTTERTPFIAASAGLATLTLSMLLGTRFRPRSVRRVLALIILFVALTALQTIPSPATQEQPSLISRLHTTSVTEPNTSVRFLYWGIALEMLRTRPLTGVGGNNYEIVYPDARTLFSRRFADSHLTVMNEQFLAQRAHNEYAQIGAELGLIGLVLFAAFGGTLIFASIGALRRARSPLVPGSISGLLAFAISSGASSISFRWMGSGLIFFFAAELVSRFAARARAMPTGATRLAHIPLFAPGASVVATLALALIMFCGMGVQAMCVLRHGAAQAASDPVQTERLYHASLWWNPNDAATNYSYGLWLYNNGRAGEAVSRLRFATERSFNSSICYAELSAAQSESGDPAGAAQTIAYATGVYPRSVFLRVRHAATLTQLGRIVEAEQEYAAALAINSREARGWQQLIVHGIDAATVASHADSEIAMPGDLQPQLCVFVVLEENERRGLGSTRPRPSFITRLDGEISLDD